MSPSSIHDDFEPAERQALESLQTELEALRARHQNDPPIDLLRAAGANALPEELQAEISRHLEGSQWSRSLIEGTQTIEPEFSRADQDRLLARIRTQARKEAPPRRSWNVVGRPVLAFALVLLVAIATWWWKASRPPAQTARQTPTVQSPAPAKPSFVLALEKPEIRFTENAIVVRGSGKQSDLLRDLAPGIKAFREDDYARAEKELARLQRKDANSVEVFFYLGVSRLFLNDVPGAIHALQQARNTNEKSFSAGISWYLAIADERNGNLQDARAELSMLCKGKSSFAARACSGLTKLADQAEPATAR